MGLFELWDTRQAGFLSRLVTVCPRCVETLCGCQAEVPRCNGPQVTSRKQNLFAAIAALLLVAALISAVVWALMVEQNRTATRGLATRPDGPELRIYGGLPNAARYGQPIVVLTNIGYLSGYCEGRRNPAWVGFSISSITVGSTAKRPSKFLTDTRTASPVAHGD